MLLSEDAPDNTVLDPGPPQPLASLGVGSGIRFQWRASWCRSYLSSAMPPTLLHSHCAPEHWKSLSMGATYCISPILCLGKLLFLRFKDLHSFLLCFSTVAAASRLSWYPQILTSVFFPGLASPMHLVGVPMSSQPKPWIKMLEETVLRTEPFWHITFPLGRELHFVQYCAYDITND